MKNTLWLWLMLAAAVGCGIARTPEPPAGSQTHFLRACAADCAAPYMCLCGVCSLPCEDNSTCDGQTAKAACVDQSDGRSCEAAPRMCDVECKNDAACGWLGTGFRCESGRCRGVAVKAPAAMVAGAKPADAGKSSANAGTMAAAAGSIPDAGTPCANTPIDKLDLLFMIDNSNSMADKQASLRAQFPKLVSILTSGRRFDGDPNPFPAVKDLHVGVVTSDMGLPGVNFGPAANCGSDGGDDGKLQHSPHGDGCAAQYPSFLSYAAMNGDPAQFANDFACIAAVGTGGCGYEQQLEAPLKALWPSVFKDAKGNVVTPNPIMFLATTPQGTLGRGDLPAAQGGNAGFLRNDPAQGLSLIAIIVVTDEDDCSSRTTDYLKPTSQYPQDSPYAKEPDLNLRCMLHHDLQYDLMNRYLKGFQLLRQGNEELVVFGAIAGVPTDLVDDAALASVDFSNDEQRNQFYDNVLSDARMQEVIDPSTMPGTGTGNLRLSCSRTNSKGNPEVAVPPRRIVTLAKMFGQNGIVQSICQEDLSGAMDPVINLMVKRIEQGARCVR
jgi:hypothetical protein